VNGLLALEKEETIKNFVSTKGHIEGNKEESEKSIE